ncbi:MAG: DUF2608 domain-containing protein [Parachlamydiales bacterium]
MIKSGILGLLLLCSPLVAFQKMDRMEEVGAHLAGAGPETLVVWDVDLVLLHPVEPAYQMANIRKHIGVYKECFLSQPNEKQRLALSQIPFASPSQLIEPEVVAVFRWMRAENVPHIALTGCLTGPLGDCPAVEDHRLSELNRLGFSFSPLLEGTVAFDELPLYRGQPILYKEGVIFANGEVPPKGAALIAFLERVGKCFERIVFIDDRLQYVRDVEEAVAAYDPTLCVEGIHYVGANHFPSPEVSSEDFVAKWEILLTPDCDP